MGDGDINFTTSGGTLGGADRIRQDVDLFLVRFNYKFGGPGAGPVVARY